MRNISLLFIVLSINCTQNDSITQQTQVVEQLCPNDRCGHEGDKSAICHLPPGNPENAQSLCIADSAVAAHFDEHEGDSCGACPEPEVQPDAGIPEEPSCEETKEGCPEPTCEELGNCPVEEFCGDQACTGLECCDTCPQDCGECEPPPPTCTETCGEASLSGVLICRTDTEGPNLTLCWQGTLQDGDYCGECQVQPE